MLILWLLLLVIYAFVSFKVQFWQTFVRLGFRAEAPLMYLRKPSIYHYFSFFLFFSALLSALLLVEYRWLAITPPILALFIATYARSKAFKEYRKILAEMLLKAESEEDKNNFLKEINKTDTELLDVMKATDKYNRY